MPRWVIRAIVYVFVGYLILQISVWLFGKLQSLILLIVVSLFLAMAIEPGVNSLVRRGWRRGSATGAVLFGLLGAVVVFAFAIGALLVDQISKLIDEAPEHVRRVEEWVNANFNTNLDFDEIADDLTAEGGPARDLAERLASDTWTLTGRALTILFQALSVGLFTFYLVADGPRLRRTICSVLRPDHQRQVLRAWEVAIDKIGGYLYSRALLAVLSTVASTIAFTVLSVDYPLALAIWVGLVSQFLPVIGTYLAGVLPVLVALVEDPIQALWVLVFIAAYQQVENYLFSPRITARTMQLHPAVAFGAAIAGAAVLGPVGAVLALPTAAVIQAFASSVPRHEIVRSALTADVRRPRRRWHVIERLRARRSAAERFERASKGDADADEPNPRDVDAEAEAEAPD